MTSYSDALRELRTIRDGNLSQSQRVIELWIAYLRPSIAGNISIDMLTVLEQVMIAGLDTTNYDISQDCLMCLKDQFPDSKRVTRLYGIYLEAVGDFMEARNVYDYLLEEDPANTLALKRKIAVLKGQNRIGDAVVELNKYLKQFMSDFDAWAELTDLYLICSDFKKAAYCMEELILSNPQNSHYYQKYAEIKYSEGGQDNIEIAKSYFNQALLLNPSSMRSLLGLLLTQSMSKHFQNNSLTQHCLTRLQEFDKKKPKATSKDIAMPRALKLKLATILSQTSFDKKLSQPILLGKLNTPQLKDSKLRQMFTIPAATKATKNTNQQQTGHKKQISEQLHKNLTSANDMPSASTDEEQDDDVEEETTSNSESN